MDKNPYDGIWTEPEQFEPWLPLTDTKPGTATSGSWQQLDDTTGTATTVEDNDWCPDPTKM